MKKNLSYMIILSILVTAGLTLSSCSKKTGCYFSATTKYESKKNGVLTFSEPASKEKSNETIKSQAGVSVCE